jgi:N-acetyl-gamma-glutamyl-phosphate reductase
MELVRLLSGHPQVEIAYLASASSAGKRLGEIYPHLVEFMPLELKLKAVEPKAIAQAADIVLMALPAGKSSLLIPALLEAGVKVIDGGPDFRLYDLAAYPKWYKLDHPAPNLLKEAVYGLPELHKEKIRKASLVACPGCYPTAALLAFAPALKLGLIEPDIIVDAKSGLSGAGRNALKIPYLYTEAAEDTCSYNLPAHRHLPEMEQEAELLLGKKVAITFAPHLVPMIRGILATVYAKLSKPNIKISGLLQCMEKFYSEAPFIHVSEELPHTTWAAGTNHAFLSARVSADCSKAILLAAIDNLGKGLSGQMVQCLNLMCGFAEAAGLEARTVYP